MKLLASAVALVALVLGAGRLLLHQGDAVSYAENTTLQQEAPVEGAPRAEAPKEETPQPTATAAKSEPGTTIDQMAFNEAYSGAWREFLDVPPNASIRDQDQAFEGYERFFAEQFGEAHPSLIEWIGIAWPSLDPSRIWIDTHIAHERKGDPRYEGVVGETVRVCAPASQELLARLRPGSIVRFSARVTNVLVRSGEHGRSMNPVEIIDHTYMDEPYWNPWVVPEGMDQRDPIGALYWRLNSPRAINIGAVLVGDPEVVEGIVEVREVLDCEHAFENSDESWTDLEDMQRKLSAQFPALSSAMQGAISDYPDQFLLYRESLPSLREALLTLRRHHGADNSILESHGDEWIEGHTRCLLGIEEPVEPPALDVSGTWNVSIDEKEAGRLVLEVDEDGAGKVAGRFEQQDPRGMEYVTPVTGTLAGKTLELTGRVELYGMVGDLSLTATVEGNSMRARRVVDWGIPDEDPQVHDMRATRE